MDKCNFYALLLAHAPSLADAFEMFPPAGDSLAVSSALAASFDSPDSSSGFSLFPEEDDCNPDFDYEDKLPF